MIVSRRAEADIAEIKAYIARDSIQFAEETAARIVSRIFSLAHFPASFRFRFEIDHHVVPVNNYAIFYRIADDTVYVMRVLHGARDYEQMLDEAA